VDGAIRDAHPAMEEGVVERGVFVLADAGQIKMQCLAQWLRGEVSNPPFAVKHGKPAVGQIESHARS